MSECSLSHWKIHYVTWRNAKNIVHLKVQVIWLSDPFAASKMVWFVCALFTSWSCLSRKLLVTGAQEQAWVQSAKPVTTVNAGQGKKTQQVALNCSFKSHPQLQTFLWCLTDLWLWKIGHQISSHINRVGIFFFFSDKATSEGRFIVNN